MTFSNKWDTHLPKHWDTDDVKAIAYSRHGLGDAHVVINNTSHLLSTPNSIVLDILEGQEILLWIINIYHAVDKHRHSLQYLFNHHLDELTPTLLIGDFNTHSHRWSMPGKCPDPWVDAFRDWMDENGLTLQNPDLTPTWAGTWEGDHPSVIDLALINESAVVASQLGPVEVSFKESLGSDHAALITTLYPSNSIALAPPSAPTGYKPNEACRAAWIKTFMTSLPYDAPDIRWNIDSSGCSLVLPENGVTTHESVTPPPSALGARECLHAHIMALNHAIETMSQQNLEPCRAPHPKGVQWWNNKCSVAQTATRCAKGAAQQAAFKALCHTMQMAGRQWAHDLLHEAADSADI